MALQQTAGIPCLVNRARIGLLQVLVSLGETEIVEPMAHEAMAAAVATRDLHSEHFAHHLLADRSPIRGECDIALPRYQRALELALERRRQAANRSRDHRRPAQYPFQCRCASHSSPASATSIPGTPTIHRARVCAFPRSVSWTKRSPRVISLKVFW